MAVGIGIDKGVQVVDGRKVLIVDDEHLIADTTALIFSHAGYDARATYSAEEALKLIQGWSPSAAILDVQLPRMDGIALGRLMRLACPDCRVALLSCQQMTDELFDSIPYDFSVFSKPIAPTELLAFVSGLLMLAR